MTTDLERRLREEVGTATTDALDLAEALHTILRETEEAETARVAISALTNTDTGRRYLAANPIGR
jgi:hypothetical protein